MNRRQAREFVMTVAFQLDLNNGWGNDATEYVTKEEVKGQYDYALDIVDKLIKNHDKIDNVINEVSDGWTTARMAKTDLAIIRVAMCEILYREDVPNAVAINEAVEMAKRYGTGSSSKFINAILGKVDKQAESLKNIE